MGAKPLIASKGDITTAGAGVMLDADSMALVAAARDRSLAFDGITIQQAAAMLGVTARTVRRWQAAGKMPDRFKHSRRKLYRAADLWALQATRSGRGCPMSDADISVTSPTTVEDIRPGNRSSLRAGART